MAIAGFGMIILLSRAGFEADRLDDFKGLNARSPWFAAVMLMVMFSMAGVPPFVGFWAKLAVIKAVLDVGMTWLAVVAVLFSVIGAYYYLRVVKLMYFDEPRDRLALEASDADDELVTLALDHAALRLEDGDAVGHVAVRLRAHVSTAAIIPTSTSRMGSAEQPTYSSW